MMPNLLCFSRNRCTGVEQLDQQTLRSYCRLQDTLMDAYVEITVRLPDLEIVDIHGDVLRTYEPECLRPFDYLRKAVGIRVGPGMKKIIKGLMGQTVYCNELAFMVEECCHGVILAFTKDTLVTVPKDEKERKRFFAEMVKENIRLYNRCAAFAPGSPLVDGIEPPK